MKIFVFVIATLFLSTCSINQKPTYDLIISNVNLIDGNGTAMQQGMNIYIKDNKIARIDSNKAEQAKMLIDGTGKYIIPGLFDCHAHTSNYEKDFPRFIHYGVTSIFITGGNSCTNEYYAEMRAMGNQNKLAAPRVFHTSQHFIVEGSHPVREYASSNWVEGKTFYYLKDTLQIEKLVEEVARLPISGIKLTIEDGPMPPPVPRMPQEFINKVAREAQKNDTKVFAHVSDNIELSMALKAGINNILHFPGVDLDFEKEKELIESIYQSNVSWVTTLMLDKSFIYALHPEWVDSTEIKEIYDSDEIDKLTQPSEIQKAKEFLDFFKTDYGLENPTFENIIGFQVQDIKTLYENGVNMVLGTDTGNQYIFPGHSLHEEMQLMEMGGMKPIDIIKMGTHNAAKMLDVLDSLGTIEKGKIADMIILDKNPLDSINNTLAINTVINEGIIQKRINTITNISQLRRKIE
jgi:imidazolonepropionase-like amidohydrolase